MGDRIGTGGTQVLRMTVEHALTLTTVTTIIKRAARHCGIPGGQVESLPVEFVQSVGGFLWSFNVRQIPVTVYANAIANEGRSVTVFNVPPNNGPDPWALAIAIQRQVAKDLRIITTAQPWPEQVEQCKPEKKSKYRKPVYDWLKTWWRNLALRLKPRAR